MTQNSTMPWIMAGMPAGWISRPARMSAAERDGCDDHAEGVELREVGDDHAREAVAGRDAVLEPVDDAPTSAMPASPARPRT